MLYFSIRIRKKLIKTCVWSVALYGAETWTLGRDEEKSLEAFETWCWRRMLKISWIDKIRNDFQRAGEERTLLKVLKRRRHKWIGHVFRHNPFVSNVLTGMVEGKVARGRPRLEYIKQVIQNAGADNLSAMKKMTYDKTRWKAANQSQD